jgi:hypothetical protein
LPLADWTLILGLSILLVTLPGALVWLASRKTDAVDNQSLALAIGGDISGTLASKVGGAGNNVGGRPLSSCRCNGCACEPPSAGVQLSYQSSVLLSLL